MNFINYSLVREIRKLNFSSFVNFKKLPYFSLVIFILLLFTSNAYASHFRYGNVQWTRVDDASRTVTFSITSAWRASYFSGVVVGDTINTAITFTFGDGTSQSFDLTVNSINASEDWFVGTATLTHTYSGTGTAFTAGFTGCCRLTTLSNGNGQNFKCITTINLVTGNLGSPVSNMPPIINLPINQTAATFNVPATDPSGLTLNYSIPNSTQTGIAPLTGLTVIPTSGVGAFNTVGKTVGQLFSASVLITNSAGSSTIVDFIIKMVASNTPPIFDYSVTPANNTSYSINPGQNITFPIRASDIDTGSTVTLSAVGLPSGNFTFTPTLPITNNPVNSIFSFTPSSSQLGIYVITFTATRNGGVQTNSTVTINVNTNPAFIAPTPSQGVTYMIPTGAVHTDVISAKNPDSSLNTKISIASIPSGASMSPSVPTAFASTATSTMSWTPAASDFGPHTLSFTAQDVNGRTVNLSYILWPNSLPSFTSTPNTSAEACAAYTYNITANDADIPYGDTIEIVSNSTLPSWLTLVDNGNGTATLSGTPTNADAGTYTINLAVEDLWHHSHAAVTQSFTVTVNDNELPLISGCAGNQSFNVIASTCAASYSIPAPVITDNCAGSYTWNASFSGNAAGNPSNLTGIADGSPSGAVSFNKGATIVTLNSVDAVGNVSSVSCSFTVTVVDNEGPLVSGCVSNQILETNLSTCSQTYSIPAPTITDNCSGTLTWNASFAGNPNGNPTNLTGLTNGSPTSLIDFKEGNTTVTLTATDLEGNLSSNSCSFIVSVQKTGIELSAKVFLGGPYVQASGLMHDSLRKYSLIPTTEPYTTPPYLKTPIAGAGGETVTPLVLAQSGNTAIVDWIMLELRDATNAGNVVANKRALLRRDGQVVSTDGTSAVVFPNTINGSYYISVKHRNHLGIMTASPVAMSRCTPTNYDFTTSTPVFTLTTTQSLPRKVFGSVYAMWPCDANNNKNVRYNGLSNDKDAIQGAVGGLNNLNTTISNAYRMEDLNMDGKIRYNGLDNDRNVILNNVGVNTPNVILNQHTPN